MLLKYVPKNEHIKMVVLSKVDGVTLTRTMVQLLPGVNEVTDSEWKCMKPNISAELERNEIVILAQKVKGKKVTDLKDMPSLVAVKFVSECKNPESLVKWYKEETREEVRVAIMDKMEEFGIEKPSSEIGDVETSTMTLDEFEDSEDEDSEDEDSED